MGVTTTNASIAGEVEDYVSNGIALSRRLLCFHDRRPLPEPGCVPKGIGNACGRRTPRFGTRELPPRSRPQL